MKRTCTDVRSVNVGPGYSSKSKSDQSHVPSGEFCGDLSLYFISILGMRLYVECFPEHESEADEVAFFVSSFGLRWMCCARALYCLNCTRYRVVSPSIVANFDCKLVHCFHLLQ